MPKAAIRKYTRLLIKSLAWIIGVLLTLMILITVLIQIPFVQDFAKDQTVSWLSGKLKTKVSIGKLRIHFPDQILIEKVYFEDQHNDSLLWGNRLVVDIALFKLLQNKVEVKSIDLDGIGINIKRVGTGTAFNFSYILKSFVSADNVDKTKPVLKPLFFKLGTLNGNNLSVKFKDDLEGINTHLSLASIHTEVKEFDIDKSVYAISDLTIEGLNVKLDRYQPLKIFKNIVANTNGKTASVLPEVRTGKISLSQTQIKYNDAIAGMHGEMNSAILLLSMGKMDLNKLVLPVEQLTVAKTNLIFSIDPQKKTATNTKTRSQKV